MAIDLNEATEKQLARRLRPRLDLGGQEFLMFVLDEMAYEYEKRYDDVIRLTLGKSELPPAATVTAAMVDAVSTHEKATLVFPPGLPELRERIALDYRERHGVEVDPGTVLINVGTSSLFRNIFQLLAGAGDEVLLPRPYYPLYMICALLVNARVRYYDIDVQSLRIDYDSLAAGINERTRIVVVNSPGNPLGNVVLQRDFARIDALVDGRALIINDEIYANAYFDDESYSALQLSNPRSPIAVTNGFSKGHRMYARRVGWAVVPEEIVEPLTVMQHHTLLCTDPVPQFGGIAALDDTAGVESLVATCRRRRDYTVAQFERVRDVYAVPSRGGFYFTLECSHAMRRRGFDDSLALARAIMEEQHVATVPGSDFGLPETLRLSFTSAAYEEGIDRLVAFFTG
jgi:aspartate/methionine/tyrosine aminotransferase